MVFDERLVEITLGDRDGYKSWKALFEDFPEDMARREKDPWNFCHPNGESSQMVSERVQPFMEKIMNLEGIRSSYPWCCEQNNPWHVSICRPKKYLIWIDLRMLFTDYKMAP